MTQPLLEPLAIAVTLVSVLAAIGSGAFALYIGYKKYRVALDRERATKRYALAIEEGDLELARRVLGESAIRKLNSNDVAVALVGAQEVGALGATTPFPEGFDALARRMVRTKNWSLRSAILDALQRVVVPLYTEHQGSSNDRT